MKTLKEKIHYHGLLAPCPQSKFKKVKLPILHYDGTIAHIFKATQYIPCKEISD